MVEEKSEGRPYLARPIHPRFRTLRVSRSGNSLSVIIPRALADTLGLHRGDELRAYVVGKVLCLQQSKWESFTPGVMAVPARGDAGPPQELETAHDR